MAPGRGAAVLDLDRGALCISIDVEVAWGFWDLPREQWMSDCFDREREIIERLVTLFDRYDVPATWAIVAGLLEEGAGPVEVDGGKPSDWHAPALVELIRSARVDHEIGSHTFSHRYFDELDRVEAAEELARARSVHERHGLPFDSFVFPRNIVGHEGALADAGLRTYRPEDHMISERVRARSNNLSRALHLLEWSLPLAANPVRPEIDGCGLIAIPGSMHLLSRVGPRRVPPAITRRKTSATLRRAIRDKTVFHLWFHPSNFFFESDTQFDLLESVLADARAAALLGELEFRTMGSFA